MNNAKSSGNLLSSIDIIAILSKIKSECKRIRDIGGSEEDLRIAIETLLRVEVWTTLKIPTPTYEHKVDDGVKGQHWGELDALYGMVIFEYKKPGELAKTSVRDSAIKKMKEVYIPGLLAEKNIKNHIESMIEKEHTAIVTGIIWDGDNIIFTEYCPTNDFFRLEPEVGSYPISENLLKRVIRRVIAAYKKKIDARLISADFGYDSELVDKHFAVKKFYSKLISPGERTLKLFTEWVKLTSQALSITDEDLREIASEYGFSTKEAKNVNGLKLFFAIQTYYTVVIKLLSVEVAARFYSTSLTSYLEEISKSIAEGKIKQKIVQLENGEIFATYGFRNFLEGELFSWYIDEWDNEIEDIILRLCNKFLEYDVESMIRDSSTTRDIFKLLYEGLVPREKIRHKIGMYTTPDWLAELVIDKITKNYTDLQNKKFLDPGAGTGTFLTLVIKKIFETTKNKTDPISLLNNIITNVVGFDIDALSVLTARANYLIALASTGLLEHKKPRDIIEIPVYLANSMVTAKELEKAIIIDGKTVNVMAIEAGEVKYFLPSKLMNRSLELLNHYKRFIDIESPFNNEKLQKIIEKYGLEKEEEKLIEEAYNNLLDLKKRRVDSVWIPILKTYLVTLFFKEFDFVVGNPPWLAYRYIANINYQKKIKDLVKDRYNLVTNESLLTHMEMATLFYIRCMDLYLKDNGKIGFVMPKSIINADQHNNFRSHKAKLKYKFESFLDTQVTPLFKVPTCALISKKERGESYPLKTTIIKGKLPKKGHKTISLESALTKLTLEKSVLYLCRLGKRTFLHSSPVNIVTNRGYYYDYFFQGASIYPHNCFFVDIVDENIPIVRTSKRAKSRAKIKDEIGDTPISRDFLFKTLTSAEIIPFSSLEPNILILPIEAQQVKYRMIKREEAKSRGLIDLANWLEKIEAIWSKQKSSKKLSIYEQIDYQNKLTNQNPKKKYTVVYLRMGSHLAAAILENDPLKILIEASLYRYETNDLDEAYYLTAVLNSMVLDDLIKPMQTRGFDGAARDIHKKPLEYPFPKFNSKNELHKKLSSLSKKTSKKVVKILPNILQKNN